MLRIRPPRSWVIAVVLAVFAGACVFSGVTTIRMFGFRPGVLFYFVFAAACGWGAARWLQTPSFEVGPDGVRFGPVTRRFDELTGLGAAEVRLRPGELVTWFHAYANDGRAYVFTDRWVGDVARFAAAVQAGCWPPAEPLDRAAALANGPRPDAELALRVDPEALERFVERVEAVYAKAGSPIRVNRRRLQARTSIGTLELSPLARRWVSRDEATWRTAIVEHRRALEAAAPHLDEVRDRLGVRVATDPGPGAVALGGGLFRAIVVEWEGSEAAISATVRRAWDLSDDELLATAVAAVRARGAVRHKESDDIHVLRGADAAAGLFCLDAWAPIDPELGALVAVPAADRLVFQPVADIASVLLLLGARLPRRVDKLFDAAERPVSPAIFWWADGKLEPIPAVPAAGGAIHWLVPDALSGRLARRTRAD
jgi:hypothetical protein